MYNKFSTVLFSKYIKTYSGNSLNIITFYSSIKNYYTNLFYCHKKRTIIIF